MTEPAIETSVSHTAYYRGLAEAVLRAWENPTSDLIQVYTFLDVGLTYGPSDEWPDLLTEGWVTAGMSDAEGQWPSQTTFETLIESCKKYLQETCSSPGGSDG